MSRAPELNLGGVAKIVVILVPIALLVIVSRSWGNRRFRQNLLNRRALLPSPLFHEKVPRITDIEMEPFDGDDESHYKDIEDEDKEKETDPLCTKRRHRFSLPPSHDVYRIDIVLENLAVCIKGDSKRQVLQGVSGTFSAGRMTAVMGPSGAGKSVLLSVLAGRLEHAWISGGRVIVNGMAGAAVINKFKEIVGFVPQEDIMHRNLTVYENLSFNAYWRLPSSMTHLEQKELLFKVLAVLELKDDILQSTIGDDLNRGISGGERKRVNIGMELVAQPSVLLLDEPTSGLDASTCLDVVQALKAIANTGVNVIAVLHQPRVEILDLFDDLLLLAPGGVTAYAGPTNQALPYFDSQGYVLPPFCNPGIYSLSLSLSQISFSYTLLS